MCGKNGRNSGGPAFSSDGTTLGNFAVGEEMAGKLFYEARKGEKDKISQGGYSAMVNGRVTLGRVTTS